MCNHKILDRFNRAGRNLLFAAISLTIVTPAFAGPQAQTGATYNSHFIALNKRLNGQLASMRECMAEMDRFEQGQYKLKTPACQRYNAMRLADNDLPAQARAELAAYTRWAERMQLPDSENVAQGQRNVTALLLMIYENQLKQATRQTYRVYAIQDRRNQGALTQVEPKPVRVTSVP